jgi:hypothetical protein
VGADKQICEHIDLPTVVLPDVHDRVQLVRDVLRNLGQPVTPAT